MPIISQLIVLVHDLPGCLRHLSFCPSASGSPLAGIRILPQNEIPALCASGCAASSYAQDLSSIIRAPRIQLGVFALIYSPVGGKHMA